MAKKEDKKRKGEDAEVLEKKKKVKKVESDSDSDSEVSKRALNAVSRRHPDIACRPPPALAPSGLPPRYAAT